FLDSTSHEITKARNYKFGFSFVFSCFRGLSALEERVTLLQVRRDSLVRVVALEQELLQLALERQGFPEAGLDAGLHGPFDAADGFAGLVRWRELPGVLLH